MNASSPAPETLAGQAASPPALSVLMPVYNAQAYLQAAIDSVLGQTFTDFEFIIMDDGSTDDSWAIIQQAAGQDGRITALQFNHGGHAALLAHGLSVARSPLVAIMHADDVSLSDRLERQWAYLQAHPQVQLVGSAVKILLGDERTDLIEANPCDPAQVHAVMLRGCCVAHPTVMFRKAAILQAGSYRAAFLPAEDYDLWLRLLTINPRAIANLPQPLLWYRIHDGQVSTRKLTQSILCTLAAQLSHRLRGQRRPDPFEDDQPITYERLASLWPDARHLHRQMIAGYGLRIVQAQRYGQSPDHVQAIESAMRAFAREHGMVRYATARLAVTRAMASSGVGLARWRAYAVAGAHVLGCPALLREALAWVFAGRGWRHG